MEISTDPAFSVCTRAPALAVEFSPYEWSRSLLAVAHPSSVAVYSIKLKEENESNEFSCDLIWECLITSEPFKMSWSPKSTLQSLPNKLQILVATMTHSILELSSDLKEENVLQEIEEHKGFINSITYSGDGNVLLGASCGDDLVAKVWNCSDNKIVAKFLLSSPGMYVKFEKNNINKLLVGEKCGILRFYNISEETITLSLRTTSPLLSADWFESNIFAVGPKGASLWNLSDIQPSKKEIKSAVSENNVLVSLCRVHTNLAAVVTSNNTMKLISLQSNKVPISVQLKVASGISWHFQLPYLAVASDFKVHLWKSESI